MYITNLDSKNASEEQWQKQCRKTKRVSRKDKISKKIQNTLKKNEFVKIKTMK